MSRRFINTVISLTNTLLKWIAIMSYTWRSRYKLQFLPNVSAFLLESKCLSSLYASMPLTHPCSELTYCRSLWLFKTSGFLIIISKSSFKRPNLHFLCQGIQLHDHRIIKRMYGTPYWACQIILSFYKERTQTANTAPMISYFYSYF